MGALVAKGVQVVRANQKDIRELRESVEALVESQMRTEEQIRKHDRRFEEMDGKSDERFRKNDERLNRLLDEIRRRRSNGHN